MYRVDIRVTDEERLQDEMQTMRTWLDHQRSEPAIFRQSRTAEGIIFQLFFEEEAQAAAFSVAFGGQVRSASGSVAL